ncbi:hypothetical protein [Mucilaginibacter myungsuensis]|uniref:Uncharacterized protein n=1 Tax=Mucilaginibacter myungsuensis TaxID=649104 RepID=A0A929KY34_9SPHI|nr:hypothetical protein [Mucilaginibacter myungsuensis]MBE9662777.1 hypothetical protein [Mucilaginibacter myungsuensis]MDN3598197.1 hypothetical protein [Mucilaginibacter myungsuensis]
MSRNFRPKPDRNGNPGACGWGSALGGEELEWIAGTNFNSSSILAFQNI